jgi:hypothetical protein
VFDEPATAGEAAVDWGGRGAVNLRGNDEHRD